MLEEWEVRLLVVLGREESEVEDPERESELRGRGALVEEPERGRGGGREEGRVEVMALMLDTEAVRRPLSAGGLGPLLVLILSAPSLTPTSMTRPASPPSSSSSSFSLYPSSFPLPVPFPSTFPPLASNFRLSMPCKSILPPAKPSPSLGGVIAPGPPRK